MVDGSVTTGDALSAGFISFRLESLFSHVKQGEGKNTTALPLLTEGSKAYHVLGYREERA